MEIKRILNDKLLVVINWNTLQVDFMRENPFIDNYLTDKMAPDAMNSAAEGIDIYRISCKSSYSVVELIEFERIVETNWKEVTP